MKKLSMLLIFVLCAMVLVTGCDLGGKPAPTPTPVVPTEAPTQTPGVPVPTAQGPAEDYNKPYEGGGNPMVTISVEGFGDMVFKLYPEYAPITVNNFVKLAEEGFYDGVVFHRIIQGFMVQSGDPTGTGMGGPGHTITGEFSTNGVQNPLSHKDGVISMARSQDPNSAGSQFFICQDIDPQSTEFLDGKYAAFGELTSGKDVLDAIAAVEVQQSAQGEMSDPVVKPVISKVTVTK